jgi:CRP/FNR family cyclic AMP-dependent transcriptional regulator
MAIADILRGCPLFHELEDREIDRITRNCRVYSCCPGELFLPENTPLSGFYIVLEGEFSTHGTGSPAGDNSKSRHLLPGDPFGESYLLGETNSPSSRRAERDSVLLELDHPSIFELYKSEPALFGLLMLNLSRILARKIGRLQTASSPFRSDKSAG